MEVRQIMLRLDIWSTPRADARPEPQLILGDPLVSGYTLSNADAFLMRIVLYSFLKHTFKKQYE